MSHKKSDLGQSLYRSRFGKRTKNITNNKKAPMKSILEQTDLERIFALGELSDRNFAGVRIISNKDKEGILDQMAKKRYDEAKEEYASLLAVPRRPKGAKYMSKEQLIASEKETFLKWLCQLLKIETDKRVKLTPYERNLDFWRQLWRVIERSDVLIQVVDARNPLLFRSEDLEKYVKEVDENKINIVLINKADFLTETQRKQWAEYFDSINLRVIFWSAKYAEETRKAEEKLAKINEIDGEVNGDESEDNEEKDIDDRDLSGNEENIEDNIKSSIVKENVEEKQDAEELHDDEEDLSSDGENKDSQSVDEELSSDGDEESYDISEYDEEDDTSSKISENKESSLKKEVIKNSWDIIGVNEIIAMLESIKIKTPNEEGKTTVGLVGYPNVGKSSTINAIFGRKKVSVSATPGHTKRFQTLEVTDKLIFCDCPGLVMPSFIHSTGHLMVSGILPIDNIRDYIAPINIIAEQFPRQTIEILYGIKLPEIRDGEDPNRPPTGREVLASYAYMHSMMTSKGNPNLDRAARIILKDYVDGRLLYRHPPPAMEPHEFESAAELPEEKRNKVHPKACGAKKLFAGVEEPELPMHDYVRNVNLANYSKVKLLPMHEAMKRIQLGGNTVDQSETSAQNENTKPWREKTNTNRCKREKMRRIHKNQDQHSYVFE